MRTRQGWIDAARGIGILLVLYGHALETLFVDRPDHAFAPLAFAQYKVIYAFHMPLFFLLSGVVQGMSAARPLRETARRSLTLLILAATVHLVGLVPALALGAEPSGTWQVVRSAARPLVEGFGFSVAVVWFLVALAIAQFLYALAAHARSPAARAALGLILAASLAALVVPGVPDLFQVKVWVPALAFFAAGSWLARRAVPVPLALAVPCGVAAAWLAGWNQGCPISLSGVCPVAHLGGHFAVHMIQGTVGTLALFVPTAALGCLAVVALARAVTAPAIAWLGRNSLDVFLANGVVLMLANPILKAVPLSGHPLEPALLVAVALALNVLAGMALPLPIRALAQAAAALAGLLVGPVARPPRGAPTPAVPYAPPPRA